MSAGPATLETIRVDADSRWDALDLAARLSGFQTYLVQLGDSRWVVCVRPEGDDVLAEVRRAAAEWAEERSLASVVRVGERCFTLPA